MTDLDWRFLAPSCILLAIAADALPLFGAA